MTLDPPAITVLDEAAAWAELSSHAVGRLAVTLAGEPEIFPVNFVIDDGGLVIRTAEGIKLLAATIGAVAVLEVDRWDDAHGTSVVARGPLRELTSAEDLEHARSLGLRPLVPTMKTHFVRIDVQSVSGRRFAFGEPTETYQPVG